VYAQALTSGYVWLIHIHTRSSSINFLVSYNKLQSLVIPSFNDNKFETATI
jgi:hypothetical protein